MKKCIYARCKREIPDNALYCQYCGRKQIHEKGKRGQRRARGAGTVYRLSGKRAKPYYASYQGKSTGKLYATKREAEEALDAMRAATHPEFFSYTLEDCYHAWAKTAYRDMSRSSRRGYQLAWKHVPEPLRQKTARDVRTDDFQGVIDEMQGSGLSDSSANHVKFLYSKLCQWMTQRDLIDKNYAQFIRVQPTGKRPIEPFAAEEVAKIGELAKGEPDERMVQTAMLTMIFLFTGMRISELFGLRRENICLDSAVPYFRGGVKTAAGRDRIIPIYHRILPFVRFFYERAEGELLISGYAGRKTADGWRACDYRQMLTSLGIPYKVPHNTRKTMATNAAQAGVNQLALTKLMGWTDIAVGNQYYIAPDAAYLAGELDKLDGWNQALDNGVN